MPCRVRPARRARPSATGIATASTLHALVERWNGAPWSMQRIRDPANRFRCSAHRRVLHFGRDLCRDRRCHDDEPDDCGMGADRHALEWLELVDSERTPQLDSTIVGYAVSCVTRSFCSAVGGLVNGEPAAMRWDGTRWSVSGRRSPIPETPCSYRACPASRRAGAPRPAGMTSAHARLTRPTASRCWEPSRRDDGRSAATPRSPVRAAAVAGATTSTRSRAPQRERARQWARRSTAGTGTAGRSRSGYPSPSS